MNKIFRFLIIPLAVLCLIFVFLWRVSLDLSWIPSMGLRATPSKEGFSEESYEAWLNAPPEKKASLSVPLIHQILEDLEYTSWKDFVDYITLSSYSQQVLPGVEPQLLMLINLSKDLSAIGIYTQNNGTYSLTDKIEGLLYVDDVSFIPLEDSDYQGIVISQTLDERFGSFFLSKFIDLYYFQKNHLERVWHKDFYQEEIYRENWIQEKGDPSRWYRIVEDTQLSHLPGDPYQINSITTLRKFQAHSEVFPDPEGFKEIESVSFQESFSWSPTYHTFILGELSQEVFLTPAALLADYHYGIEQLYGFDNDYYQLMTQKGEIFYLPGSKFKGLLHFLLEE